MPSIWMLQITEGGMFVAERDGTVLGFVALEPRADGVASHMIGNPHAEAF